MSDAGRSLRVDFASEAEFKREYASNIANGGIFVATNVGFDVREAVRVEIALAWRDETLALEGEVVHVLTPELAGPAGVAGVAVQFLVKTAELRERFEALVGDEAIEDEREKGTGRRATRRSPVRVPAFVCCLDGRELEGRTRDLSTTGALVSLGGERVEVGQLLALCLTNPSTDEELEIDATVMRHVPSASGFGPVAMGLRFEVEPTDTGTVELFVKSIQVAERSRRFGGITGPIAEVGIENLLQMFGTCAPEGTLRLFNGEDTGFIMFQGGMLRAAEFGESYGRKALSRMLEWKIGTFEFNSQADAERFRGDAIPLDAAMLDALRLYDEGQRPSQSPLPDDATLVVDEAKLAAAQSELSQGEEAILDLASVGMTIAKVIDIIPEPDVEVRSQIVGLLARGLISLEE